MSAVNLLAADHPLPLYDPELRRIRTVKAEGGEVTVETPGFSVQPHAYYRDAVEQLGLELKPCQYEVNLCPTEEEAALLRAYLKQNCVPGETVELWYLWVGTESGKPRRFSGPLEDLDRAALEQLEARPLGQTCLSIRISRADASHDQRRNQHGEQSHWTY